MTTTVVEPVFVDTNNLIYAQQKLSPFHLLATSKLTEFANAGHSLWVSRQVLREYLVAMSRPSALTSSIPMPDLIWDVQLFEKQFIIAEDGPGRDGSLARSAGIDSLCRQADPRRKHRCHNAGARHFALANP